VGPNCPYIDTRFTTANDKAIIETRTRLHRLDAAMLLAAAATGIAQPIITQQPLDQTNIVGTTAMFTVSAAGTTDPAYQWQKFSESWITLVNQTNATLVLTNVQISDGTDYRAVVNNTAGTTNSTSAHLYVLVPPKSPQPSTSSIMPFT
jgi:hypothetical protein